MAVCENLGAFVEFSSRERLWATWFAYVLFALMSTHFVLVALWLAAVGSAQAALFGQREEISGVELIVWSACLFYCGMSGLLALVWKSSRAATQALVCWLLLLALHAMCLAKIALSAGETRGYAYEMTVQVLADGMNAGFVAWLVIQNPGDLDVENDTQQQPLLESTFKP
ncbi:unnamed protein product [Phytophthora lilii]|uniref:Unnamed protein product n=1 Tax=Phytophthora lilii TaxID=2077276 RepID=A0A9W6TN75_9STRA|nr:unnamed protein product [Phytophthora lilii]